VTDDYYTTRLSANRLKECYDIAPSRVIEYLNAELEYVLTHIDQNDDVLELGCGYGRFLDNLLHRTRKIVGIDISVDSLELAKRSVHTMAKCHFFQMDAQYLGFRDNSFDKTICIQNGISAFKIDPKELVMETIRVTRDGGTCLFSSYSDRFWEYRLEWFKMQSEKGLIGAIDWKETGNGVIVCEDGFRATTFREEDFRELASSLCLNTEIVEVDESSIFCKVTIEK
jgi:ubiquinone/menaquinone biosynthesis C-methylase UbiE